MKNPRRLTWILLDGGRFAILTPSGEVILRGKLSELRSALSQMRSLRLIRRGESESPDSPEVSSDASEERPQVASDQTPDEDPAQPEASPPSLPEPEPTRPKLIISAPALPPPAQTIPTTDQIASIALLGRRPERDPLPGDRLHLQGSLADRYRGFLLSFVRWDPLAEGLEIRGPASVAYGQGRGVGPRLVWSATQWAAVCREPESTLEPIETSAFWSLGIRVRRAWIARCTCTETLQALLDLDLPALSIWPTGESDTRTQIHTQIELLEAAERVIGRTGPLAALRRRRILSQAGYARRRGECVPTSRLHLPGILQALGYS